MFHNTKGNFKAEYCQNDTVNIHIINGEYSRGGH